MKQNRNQAIDLLKAISIISVITIHTVSTGLLHYPIGDVSWLVTVFYGSAVRFAVPVFFMCSGALFLNPHKKITIKDIWTRYLPRILVALLFIATVYELYDIVGKYSATGAVAPWPHLWNILTFNHHFHLYFLHIIIIVYVFLPITKVFIDHATKKQLEYGLALWFVLGICLPLLRNFTDLYIVGRYTIPMTFSAIGYGVLGHYLNTYSAKKPVGFGLLYLFGLGITFCGTAYFSIQQGVLAEFFLEGMSPGVALMAAGLFGCAICLFKTRPCPKIAAKLSAASFCIYLFHDFFNMIFLRNNITIHLFTPIFSIPALVLANLALSYLLYLLLRKISFVKKYLL